MTDQTQAGQARGGQEEDIEPKILDNHLRYDRSQGQADQAGNTENPDPFVEPVPGNNIADIGEDGGEADSHAYPMNRPNQNNIDIEP